MKKMNLKEYADFGATMSLNSDAVLSEKILKSLSVYKGNVKDANGNTVNTIGRNSSVNEVNFSLIYEKILVFKKTSAIVHDILLGMTILTFAELSFVKSNVAKYIHGDSSLYSALFHYFSKLCLNSTLLENYGNKVKDRTIISFHCFSIHVTAMSSQMKKNQSIA